MKRSVPRQDTVRYEPPSTGSQETGGHATMMKDMHRSTLWVHFVNIGLGLWLATAPFAFDNFSAASFSSAVYQVTQERGLADPAVRLAWLGWSDLVSGLLVMLFGICSLSSRLSWAQWANTGVGLWLLFAPLVFWAPDPLSYNNDVLVGALVIAFSVLIPMMPGMSHAGMMDESDMPPGWTYAPSTYLQRLPIAALALVGFLISRHLTAYQLGHIDYVWDPFFGVGTAKIITSDVSKAWPIADAGLGAISYVLEILMAVMGDRRRWRTMPWMVLAFGIVVVPLGVVSIFFIIIQPIMIGTWCTLCLAAALAMLIMIPYTLDELVAMGQFLKAAIRQKKPFWTVMFRGDEMKEASKSAGSGLELPAGKAFMAAARGVTLPWTLLASVALGIWMMFTRLLFDTEGVMANSDHLVGSLVVTVAIIAMAEVARPLRFVNMLFGLWLMAGPWILSGSSADTWNGLVVGATLIALSLPNGRVGREHYGAWDNLVF